jgi:hypothetical protein
MTAETKRIRNAVKAVVMKPHSILFVNEEQIRPKYFIDAVKGLEFPWPTPVIFTKGGTDISLFTEEQLVAAIEAIQGGEAAAQTYVN